MWSFSSCTHAWLSRPLNVMIGMCVHSYINTVKIAIKIHKIPSLLYLIIILNGVQCHLGNWKHVKCLWYCVINSFWISVYQFNCLHLNHQSCLYIFCFLFRIAKHWFIPFVEISRVLKTINIFQLDIHTFFPVTLNKVCTHNCAATYTWQRGCITLRV